MTAHCSSVKSIAPFYKLHSGQPTPAVYEIASKQLDYPIFMAVSERGGKNNSGNYEYILDEDGSFIEFPDSHPQAGQFVVNQDLVNYNLRPEDLTHATTIPDDKLCIAEAFIQFAQEQGLSFWKGK